MPTATENWYTILHELVSRLSYDAICGPFCKDATHIIMILTNIYPHHSYRIIENIFNICVTLYVLHSCHYYSIAVLYILYIYKPVTAITYKMSVVLNSKCTWAIGDLKLARTSPYNGTEPVILLRLEDMRASSNH